MKDLQEQKSICVRKVRAPQKGTVPFLRMMFGSCDKECLYYM